MLPSHHSLYQNVIQATRLHFSSLMKKRLFGTLALPPVERQKVVEAAIVGLPNAGKSSLLNVLLARRMAAVSNKRNTTRSNLLAVGSDFRGGVQVLFYDTPGFVSHLGHGGNDDEDDEGERAPREKGRVDRSVMVSGRDAVGSRGNNVTLVVVDVAKNLTPSYEVTIPYRV